MKILYFYKGEEDYFEDFVKNFSRLRDKKIILTFNKTSDFFETFLKKHNLKTDDSVFIDLVTRLISNNCKDTKRFFYPKNRYRLDLISERIKRLTNEGYNSVVLDSLEDVFKDYFADEVRSAPLKEFLSSFVVGNDLDLLFSCLEDDKNKAQIQKVLPFFDKFVSKKLFLE